MDTRDGRIYTEVEMIEMRKVMKKADDSFLKMMSLQPTEKQMARRPPKVGRNEPCPCGSGKKFKKCCLVQEDSDG